MLVIAVAFLVVVVSSVRGLRAAAGGARWPFLVGASVSGAALLALAAAAVIASTAGRETWNSWVSGTQSSEAVTLWVVLIAGPVLLATCAGLLVLGAVLRSRQRRRSKQSIVTASR
jgi:RsiW-degrading membrane proteinase PrsW (M82 family)